jgi:hypothetical protein
VEIVWGQGFIGKTEKMCICRIKKGDTTEDIADTTEHTNKIPRRYRDTVMKIDCVEGITYNLLKGWGGGTVKRECPVQSVPCSPGSVDFGKVTKNNCNCVW